MNYNPAWAGVDEVGRGCLAGPVVAAAVFWDADSAPAFSAELRDSKKVAARKRQQLAIALVGDPNVNWTLTWLDVEAIDRLNILQASLRALADAVSQLGPEPPGVYVDGNQTIDIEIPQQTVVGGDDKVPQIAAASILAKVFRDRWMASFDHQYPGYAFAKHKGYGTAQHLQALRELGPSPLHRKSFAPIKQLALF